MHESNQFRILAVSLSTEGFGYAVMEGNNTLVDYGNKVVHPDKNAHSLTHIDEMIVRYLPGALVLLDLNAKGTYRAPRIKELHRQVLAMAKRHNLKVVQIPNTELRTVLLDNHKATKHDIAVRIGKLFPDELESRVPPKRKRWESQRSRMDIFDAVALAVVFRMKRKELH